MRRISTLGFTFTLAVLMLLAACAPAGGPEDPGVVEFSTSQIAVTEGDPVVLTVLRTGGFAGDASVDFATREGTATAGDDYESAAGTRYWVDGEETVELIEIETLSDNQVEGDETFFVTLSAPAGTELGTIPEVTVTIEESVEAPRVVSTSPPDGADDVSLNRSISVTFSEAMDRSPTEAAFSASPDPGCVFSWNSASTTLTCDPQGDLDPSTSYQVTIGTGAQSSPGVALANEYSFQFETGTATDTTAPFVVDTTPDDGATDVGLNTDISVTFSEEMNRSATEAAFSSNPSVDCAFRWNAAGDRLTCNTQSDLTASTDYTITIDTGAEDTAGNALVSTESFSFTTGTTTLSTCVFGSSTFGNCVFGP
jgi:hypothetical protein